METSNTPPATPDAGAREAEIARVISSEIGDAIAAHEAGEGEAAVSKRGETVARWIMDRIHPTPPRAASPDPVAVWVVREPSGNVIGAGASYHAALHDAQLNGGLPLALVFRLMEGIEKGDTLVMSGGYALMRESLATASRADATAGGVKEVLIAALRDIATNYDHDEQTREHTPGYGGACRVCTAEAALRAAQPDGGAK